MAKIDWEAHQKAFTLMRRKNPSLTRQQYCEQVGIKFSTAKSRLKVNAPLADEPEKPKVRPASKTKKPKRDYEALLLEYLDRAANDTDLSVAAFAKEKGLPEGSTRRQFNKLRQLDRFKIAWDRSQERRDQILAAVGCDTTRRKALKSNGKSATEPLGATAPENGSDGEKPQKEGMEPQFLAAETAALDDFDLSVERNANRDHLGRFGKGHTHNALHGAYMKATNLNPALISVVASIDSTAIENEQAIARTQYLMMLNYVTEEQNKIDERVENDGGIFDQEGNELDPAREKAKVLFQCADKMRSLESTITSNAAVIAKMNHDKQKLMIAAANLPALTAEEERKLINKALTERMKPTCHWTAMETVARLESLGCTAPPFLLHEAKAELDAIEPEIDDSGVTDDELEEISRQYQEDKVIPTERWLHQRRREVFDAFESQEAIENGEEPDYQPDELEDALQEEAYSQIEEEAEGFDDIGEFTTL